MKRTGVRADGVPFYLPGRSTRYLQVCQFYEGTSDIQRLVIARALKD